MDGFATISSPSMEFHSAMRFGKWLWPSRRLQTSLRSPDEHHRKDRIQRSFYDATGSPTSHVRSSRLLGALAPVVVALLFSSHLALAQFTQQGPKLVANDAVGTPDKVPLSRCPATATPLSWRDANDPWQPWKRLFDAVNAAGDIDDNQGKPARRAAGSGVILRPWRQCP
jgi:hypothetical protein